jgi:hypothetical protein|tara:strand:+ start:1762 stop:2082 length:321 start_codon:yes stop_codon:yes gene_type:complete
MSKSNEVIMGDTVYEMSPAYIDGARAMRRSTTFHANPYSDRSQEHADWDFGHTHEAAGEHFRFGLDLIAQPATGASFEEDPAVPRDEDHNVDQDWIDKQMAAREAA